jgi:hypothetical protein
MHRLTWLPVQASTLQSDNYWGPVFFRCWAFFLLNIAGLVIALKAERLLWPHR